MFKKQTSLDLRGISLKYSDAITDSGLNIHAALSLVSKDYHISQNPDDYCYMVLKALHVDVPNANGDNFSYEEMMRQWPDLKLRAYQTFILKPHFLEHAASDELQARGVVLDAHIVSDDVNDRDKYVELLLAVDKRKDPLYAWGVEKGVLDKFSMGCEVEATKCSICGNVAKTAMDYCDDVKDHKMQMVRGRLCYEDCLGVVFGEISGVSDPADEGALQKEVLSVKEKFAYSGAIDKWSGKWNFATDEWKQEGLPAEIAFDWDYACFSPKDAMKYIKAGINLDIAKIMSFKEIGV